MRRRHQGHEPMHPRGTCRSCSVRRTNIQRSAHVVGWGTPEVRAGRPTYAPWTPIEDRILRESTGVRTAKEVCEKIRQETGQIRTENAVHIRMQRTGIPRLLPGYSIGEVRLMMGVSYTVAQQWVKAGLIGPPNPRWTIATVRLEDLERFIRERTDLYDWKRITDPQLQSIGRAAWVRDPWITVAVVSRMIKRCPESVRRLFVCGTLPGRKVAEWNIRPGGIRWVARRSEITRLIAAHPHLIGPYGSQAARSAASAAKT